MLAIFLAFKTKMLPFSTLPLRHSYKQTFSSTFPQPNRSLHSLYPDQWTLLTLTFTQYSRSGTSGHIPLIGSLLTPWGNLHKRMASSLGIDKEYAALPFMTCGGELTLTCDFRAMKRDVRTVAGWDFERIIPCHGVRVSALLLFGRP